MDLSSPTCELYDTLHAVVCGPDGHVECEADIPCSEYATGYRFRVGHYENVYVTVYPSGLSPYFSGGEFHTGSGRLCPELKSYHALCNTLSDHCEAAVVIRKNYCDVKVDYVTNSAGDMLMEICCRFEGLRRDGTPLQGEYRLHEGISGDAGAIFRIPRQGDDSVMLAIYSASGSTRSYAIGNAMARSGYDWTKEDLDDITIRVDYTLMTVSVRVGLWQDEIFLPVVV